MTVPLGDRGHTVDLPDTDPRVRRRVTGWAPEQVAVALSAEPTSAWISWITGAFQMGGGGGVKPLDPSAVGSVVRYGLAADSLPHEAAAGESLVYSQLYPMRPRPHARGSCATAVQCPAPWPPRAARNTGEEARRRKSSPEKKMPCFNILLV